MKFSFKHCGQTHLAGRFKRRNGHFAAVAAGGETLWCGADGLSDGDGAWRGQWCALGQNPSCERGQEHLTERCVTGEDTMCSSERSGLCPLLNKLYQ